MSNALIIFAEITPKPEHFKDAQQAIIGILAQTRAESGCYSFKLFEAPDQDKLYLFEEWQDQDALDQHLAQPYTVAVFKSYEGWLAEPPRILPLRGLT
ncbi:quinol monooxygenase YgiN [Sulfitobacter undariae]|uniref:Quinol monooxygenase YgiN n=1 Tax=Sulfitobacter undariae TaxID=1563671 RepID=A0A7W6E2X0_9RHOB|nr:putative quinol monooxygenase [Sulfitobacter undariae]MBB3993294.1 quinol monooxygenase YgiN [Sulfitobacter undariae]